MNIKNNANKRGSWLQVAASHMDNCPCQRYTRLSVHHRHAVTLCLVVLVSSALSLFNSSQVGARGPKKEKKEEEGIHGEGSKGIRHCKDDQFHSLSATQSLIYTGLLANTLLAIFIQDRSGQFLVLSANALSSLPAFSLSFPLSRPMNEYHFLI